ncbi:MAG: hypothetical protein HIU84_09095 [Acidobacteria bacterium]|nr:hypothetical protein [Acidobacteriota bacterium]
MTKSMSKLERPAIFGDFGLSVDDVSQPSRVAASRAKAGTTFEEVASRTYAEVSNVDDLVEWLVSFVGFPTGVARALVMQLTAKVHASALRA